MVYVKKGKDIALVVDDSPDTLSLLTEALDEAGMTVLVAVEGPGALVIIDRVKPDIVLMDAMMPGMDGFETTRQLKRKPSMVHVPVIFMTGLSETEHIVSGFAAGCVDYVTKPINPDELLARIRVHLANARRASSAQVALDVSGRHLLGVNPSGELLWSTPQASKLLDHAVDNADPEHPVMPMEVRTWLSNLSPRQGLVSASEPFLLRVGNTVLPISYVGNIGPDEILLRLHEQQARPDEIILRERLSLTPREAEVLAWLARGKSSRDIAEILNLSPRTVNKHLEQMYAKLGVENRAAAATLAVRTVGRP
jgi:DNA-binding NarL/FixJ family response regulator